jgi:transcription elongation factor GreA
MSDIIEQKKKALHEEMEKLREEFYVELPKRIAEARSLGDLKENSEYDAARERQAFVKARIGQLSRLLAQYSEAAASPTEEKKIGFGSVVLVLELNSNTRSEYTIVHPAEVDPDAGKISLSSQRRRGGGRHRSGRGEKALHRKVHHPARQCIHSRSAQGLGSRVKG